MTAQRFSEDQERNVLTSVVGSGIGRVITMVSSNHEQIIFTHIFNDFWDASIKLFQAVTVAMWITAVTLKSIKVY